MTTQDFVSSLFEIETNMHIAHLQTTSYAEHKALGEVYEEIVKHRDAFIESYQGKKGIIKNYKSFTIKENITPSVYLREFASKFEAFRDEIQEGYLQQIVDNIIELLYSNIYKLRFLK